MDCSNCQREVPEWFDSPKKGICFACYFIEESRNIESRIIQLNNRISDEHNKIYEFMTRCDERLTKLEKSK